MTEKTIFFFLIRSTFSGMALLVFTSAIQKWFLGGWALALNPRAYIASSLIGALFGLLFGLWHVRLHRATTRYRLISDFSSDCVYLQRPDGSFSYLSPACLSISGFSPQEFLDQPGLVEKIIHPDDLPLWQSQLEDARDALAESSREMRLLTREGQLQWIEHTCRPIKYTKGGIAIRGSIRNTTERRRIEQELRESEARYLDLLENANDLIQSTSSSGKILYVNRAWREALGYTLEESQNLHMSQFIHADSTDHCLMTFQELLAGKKVGRLEAEFVTKKGEKILIEGSVNCRFENGRPVATRGIFRDITERKKAEARIERLAYYDTLTNLPNRDLFHDRLEQELARARRHKHMVGVAFLDLDHFKSINDSLGHAQGDLLLKEVAKRLAVAIRESDTVSRFGGDEFAFLLPDLKIESDAAMVADKVLEQFAHPFQLSRMAVTITPSLGLATFPRSGRDADTLLKNADAAMYQAKSRGRNTYQFFSDEMNAKALQRLLLTNDLRLALERDELFLEYQPQMDMAQNRLLGFEALLRWNHPENGLISPGSFIPLAEETNLILPIGRWVLKTACEQSLIWEKILGPVTIAVNLSPKQFKEPNLVQMVKQTLAETGLNPSHLELELTESMLMDNAGDTVETLRKLRSLGIRLSIDDFGTGYSSLNYLKHFPIDRLKIDQSFISGVPEDHDDAAITASVIALARSLNLQVLAEGVETPAQLDYLLQKGCTDMQGFLCSRPLSAEAVHAFVASLTRN
ncbi:bifunctional diguanylate cyclase/phosphodiesterase [Desulfuromonas sp. AOP6]|uniref:sensor domain-containing protein n=1 Tax=Desulfuromonas sp. AOP6 TaxID=1566351 RepID=UPI00128A19E5|nr:bifunctional diguanylate cyclase/phosphodiesterase [Desulfuromonas sp. AOP6]BCA78487.1 hypothetical protein AOP6_0274 [Desulfuromonas sp. AOP6]